MKHFKLRGIAVLIVLGFLVSGCATKARSGAGLGALTGGLIGSQFGPAKSRGQSALIGAAIGALVGYAIGNEMDKYDRQQLNQAYEKGKSNVATAWVNPDTHNEYKVTPKPAFRDPEGRLCRDAHIDAIINGKHETAVTKACRTPDGVWELQG